MDDSQHFDLIDIACALGLFACFVIFGVCMWFLRRELDKKKAANRKNANK